MCRYKWLVQQPETGSKAVWIGHSKIMLAGHIYMLQHVEHSGHRGWMSLRSLALCDFADRNTEFLEIDWHNYRSTFCTVSQKIYYSHNTLHSIFTSALA